MSERARCVHCNCNAHLWRMIQQIRSPLRADRVCDTNYDIIPCQIHQRTQQSGVTGSWMTPSSDDEVLFWLQHNAGLMKAQSQCHSMSDSGTFFSNSTSIHCTIVRQSKPKSRDPLILKVTLALSKSNRNRKSEFKIPACERSLSDMEDHAGNWLLHCH